MNLQGIVGNSAMSDIDREAWLSAMPQEGLVVEVGTLCGATCRWVAERCAKVRFLCVDPFRKAQGTGPGIVEHWMHNRRANMNLFVGTLQELRSMLPVKASLILVDGDHSEAGAYADLSTAQCMTDLILCHDVGRDGELAGVTRAVNRFVAERTWNQDWLKGSMACLRRK